MINKDRLKRAKEQGFDIDTIWYHVTNTKIKEFDTNKTADSCIWLTNNINSAKNGELGAAGSEIILPLYIRANNLAGWEEEDRLSNDQIIQEGFDGVLLDDDVKIYNPELIRSIEDNFLPENINSKTLNHSIENEKNDLEKWLSNKEKNTKKYFIDYENPINKEINISEITIDRGTLCSVLRDIKLGDISRDLNNIQTMYDNKGDLIIFDGFHRLIENIIYHKKNNISVDICFDERCGEKFDAHRMDKNDIFKLGNDITKLYLEPEFSKEDLIDIEKKYLTLISQRNKNPFKNNLELFNVYDSLQKMKNSNNNKSTITQHKKFNLLLKDNSIIGLYNENELKIHYREQLKNKKSIKIKL
jgi:hypothetical protein